MWAGYPQSKISQTSTMAQERCFSNSGSQSTNMAATNVVDHKEYFLINETVLLKTSASMVCMFKG